MKVSYLEIIIQQFIVILIFIFAIVKKKLTIVGSFNALIIGFFISFSGYEYMIILVAFFGSSVGLTSVYKKVKMMHLGKTYSKEKTRNGYQVCCKGFFPTFICIIIFYLFEGRLDLFNTNLTNLQKLLYGMYIGFFVAANSDTWASEIGINSKEQPFLLTKMQRVPKGINGAISFLGTIASFLGGLFISLSAIIGAIFRNYKIIYENKYIFYQKSFIVLILGLICGGLGSFIDSILGSITQISYYDTEQKCIIDKEDYNNFKDKSKIKVYGYDIFNNSLINLITGILTSIISGILYIKFI